MIRRPPRSTHCISSAASDVYKRQDYTYPATSYAKNYSYSPRLDPNQTQPQNYMQTSNLMKNSQRVKTWKEYFPVQKTLTDWVPQYRVEYVPVERPIQDYIEVEHNVDYVPVPRYEKRIEYIPVEKYEEKIDYEPVYSSNYSGYHKNQDQSRQYLPNNPYNSQVNQSQANQSYVNQSYVNQSVSYDPYYCKPLPANNDSTYIYYPNVNTNFGNTYQQRSAPYYSNYGYRYI
eukprot:TRINITY_DN201_c0_g2_i1.p2 TRINITY_DN201_c0_g2~~TRINITY_DN201_c0_g2_i1.p2  ORF type:complete len:231 (-),score=45.39 TRINITY_DN201_c0_g2_i1:506-1198(-)